MALRKRSPQQQQRQRQTNATIEERRWVERKKSVLKHTRCRTSSFWAHVVNLKFVLLLLLMWKAAKKNEICVQNAAGGSFLCTRFTRARLLGRTVGVAKSNLFFVVVCVCFFSSFYSKTKLSKQWQWNIKRETAHRQWTGRNESISARPDLCTHYGLICMLSRWDKKNVMVCFWHIKPSEIHANFYFHHKKPILLVSKIKT